MSISTSKVSDLLAPKAKETKKNDLTSRDEFLQLLVVQLKNQDPMDPMKSGDFSAQLAQFSQLEQLISIKEALEKGQESDILLNQAYTNTMSATFIGKSVKALGDKFNHVNEEAENIYFSLEDDAESIKVEIKNSSGVVIKTITAKNLKQGENTIIWDGKENSGTDASSGTYTYDVYAKDIFQKDVNVSKYILGRVEGVKFSEGAPYFIVNGDLIILSSISEVFE